MVLAKNSLPIAGFKISLNPPLAVGDVLKEISKG
jgi:hypothetical protein